MDKSSIKTHAVDARNNLIAAVTRKANQLYLFEDESKSLRPGKEAEQLRSDGIFLTPEQLRARGRLYDSFLTEDIPYKPAIFRRRMEEIAYTWFNRLISLRYMEINDVLPSGIRILSSKDKGRIEPDALREVDILPYVDKAKVTTLRADTSFNAPEKLYRYILIAQCNTLSEKLPGMFQRIDDYTELLLPDNLYTTGGIVHDLVSNITEDNFIADEQGHIEIIGWLYQYYTSEKKDEVFAALKKNVKLNKDTIPAATQLFTPEWIVKYMVENSLGRLWLEKHPNDKLRKSWKYYVDEAEQEPEVAEQLRILRSQSPINRPEDIRLIDPCMGSGHILVYAFDVLFQIYESVGYAERDIPNLILRHNLYGLDIDERAAQLTYFALMMKAVGYNRRFLRQKDIPQPMVVAVPESRDALVVLNSPKYLGASMDETERAAADADFRYVVGLFESGKELGSLIRVERDIDFDRLRRYVNDHPKEQLSLEDAEFTRQAEAFEAVFKAAVLLVQRYDVVVTNPPYMGSKGQGAKLVEFLAKNYADAKTDTFSAFILRCCDMAKPTGYIGMFTPYVWMFIQSYEKLRNRIYNNQTIKSLIQHEYSAFEEATVPVCSFVLSNKRIGEKGLYFRLVDFRGGMEIQRVKYLETIRNPNCGCFFTTSSENFEKIPGMPVAYWISRRLISSFEHGMSLAKLLKRVLA